VVHADVEFSGDSTNDQVQSAINEGRLKFAENHQMKLDEDRLQVSMNTVELEGKKVLVWPSQAESTKGKEVVIGEEREPRMIRTKNQKIG
jgi:GH43 family beta-xylosidase